jgi:hypothetical protein
MATPPILAYVVDKMEVERETWKEGDQGTKRAWESNKK